MTSGPPLSWSGPAGIRGVLVRTGVANADVAGPVKNPTQGPVFRPFRQAVAAKLPTRQVPVPGFGLAGSTNSELVKGTGNISGPVTWHGAGTGASGAPVKNPTQGPVFVPKPWPDRARWVPGTPKAGVFSAELAPGTGNVSAALNGAGFGNGIGANGAPVSNPAQGPVFRQAVQAARARLPLQPLLRGRCYSNPGAPVSNPSPGPQFIQKPQPVRFILPPPQPRAGRIGSNRGGPVINPIRGPTFRPATAPALARQPLPRRGRTYATAKPAALPPATGPVFTPAVQALRARLPQQPFLKGRVQGSKGAPVRNPSSGPVFTQAVTPDQARIPQTFSKGRTASNPGTPAITVTAGPVFRQADGPARARIPQNAPRGRVASSPGGPVRNPAQGPRFRQAVQALRPRLPLLPQLTGRIRSNPGTATPIGVIQTASGTGLPLTFTNPVTAGNTIFLLVYTYSTTGVTNTSSSPLLGGASVPGTVAFFDPGVTNGVNSASLGGNISYVTIWMLPNCPGGATTITCTINANLIGAVAYEVSGLGPHPALDVSSSGTSTTSGPIDSGTAGPTHAAPEFVVGGSMHFNGAGPGLPAGFTTVSPAADALAGYQVSLASGSSYDWQQSASNTFVPWSAALAAVRQPGPAQTGPPFYPVTRIHPAYPPATRYGRVASSPGAPAVVPGAVPVYGALPGAVRACLPVNLRGRTQGSPGAPPAAPHAGPPFYPAPRPVRAAAPPPFSKGRVASSPAAPAVRQGPAFRQATQPVRARLPLPPRGRIWSSAGAPVRNPSHGPVFIQKPWPARARIPQNAPRGRTASNPGGPVQNIPSVPLQIRTGSPYIGWTTDVAWIEWELGGPYTGWTTGVPYA